MAKKNEITLKIEKSETIQLSELTDREKAIYQAAQEELHDKFGIFLICSILLTGAICVVHFGIHNYYHHGSFWF